MKRLILLLILGYIMGQLTTKAQVVDNNVLMIKEQARKAEQPIALEDLLRMLENKYDVTFVYKSLLVEGKTAPRKIVEAKDFSTALNELVNILSLEYEKVGRRSFLLSSSASLQAEVRVQETILGTVTDGQSGETLPGVNILVKGTSTGASTNSDGNYELTVSSLQDTLVFSFIGYQTQEVPINGRTEINVAMQPQAITGEEMVVVGYGTQSRETITGSISTVTSDDFNTGQVSDPLTLISGKVAGLAISNPNAGDPNASSDFSLRGPATLQGNSQPLIVIDGVPGGDLQAIAPSNIASIDVLKGGSAAAIYGSRATAGVIIVTTKKGEPGNTRVSYSGSISTEVVANEYDMLNAEQYRSLAEENDFTLYDEGANTDWFDAVTRTPVSHTHNLSFSGGVNNTTYFTSLNYRNFEGVDLVSQREFINGTAQVNTSALEDKLDFSFKITSTQDDRNFSNRGALAQALKMFPTFPVKNENNSFFEEPDIQFGLQWNPVASMRLNSSNSEGKKLLSTANLAYSILPTLESSVTYSLIKNDFLSSNFSSSNDFFQQRNNIGGQASRSENQNTTQNLEATLAYQAAIKNHNFDVLAGYSYQNIFNEGFSAGNNNFSTDAFRYYNLGAGTALNNLDPNVNRSGVFVGSYASERTLKSYFGRIIYDFQQRYLLNVSIRREGASVLGSGNKWGTFSGISAGWRLTSEEFMEDLNGIKNLKLRAGYGVTGNQQSLSPYQSLATVGPFFNGTHNAYYGEPGNAIWMLPYGPTANANPALQWETKKELNVGLDFAFFKNGWLSGSLDYYNRSIENLVGNYSAQLPPQIFPSIFANAGEMKNEGFELMLNTQLANSTSFNWNATLTGSYNKNEIVSISSEQFKGTAQDITYITEGTSAQRLAPGHSVASFYGRVFAGFTEDGQWLFENNEGDAVPASEIGEDDFANLGNSIPRYNLALTNTFNVGSFDLSLLLQSAIGFNAVNAKRLHFENMNYFTRNNLFESALEDGIAGQPIFSSYYIENGDYLKIKNLRIGYTFPIQKIGLLKKLRIYINGTNLATFTSFSGNDPELRINWVPSNLEESETSNGPGVESLYDYFPSTRRFELGVNINF